MIVFSDLHLREGTEDICFEVLLAIYKEALKDPSRHVVFCGDFWQLRYQVVVRLLNKVSAYLREWKNEGIRLDIIPGNHDQISTEGENALSILDDRANGIFVWSEPGYLNAEKAGYSRDGGYAFIPYRADQQQQYQMIKEAFGIKGVKFIFSHFGIKGAVVKSGNIALAEDQALDLSIFPFNPKLKNNPYFILGHYHVHQEHSHYVYCGSPYQQNFGEAGTSPGYLEVNTNNLIFRHVSWDIGPRYHIVKWDVAGTSDPPSLPVDIGPLDRVRLDVSVPFAALADSEIITKAKNFYEGVVINILPYSEERERKFIQIQGEGLKEAAVRFVHERCPDENSAKKRIALLDRWG